LLTRILLIRREFNRVEAFLVRTRRLTADKDFYSWNNAAPCVFGGADKVAKSLTIGNPSHAPQGAFCRLNLSTRRVTKSNLTISALFCPLRSVAALALGKPTRVLHRSIRSRLTRQGIV
jgi:hypothetical protein